MKIVVGNSGSPGRGGCKNSDAPGGEGWFEIENPRFLRTSFVDGSQAAKISNSSHVHNNNGSYYFARPKLSRDLDFFNPHPNEKYAHISITCDKNSSLPVTLQGIIFTITLRHVG